MHVSPSHISAANSSFGNRHFFLILRALRNEVNTKKHKEDLLRRFDCNESALSWREVEVGLFFFRCPADNELSGASKMAP